MTTSTTGAYVCWTPASRGHGSATKFDNARDPIDPRADLLSLPKSLIDWHD
jgi:hypothetical protein